MKLFNYAALYCAVHARERSHGVKRLALFTLFFITLLIFYCDFSMFLDVTFLEDVELIARTLTLSMHASKFAILR